MIPGLNLKMVLRKTLLNGVLILGCLLSTATLVLSAWGADKVLLRDVSVLTLYDGQMTTGRRSSPVPQLKCVGGSAGCSQFKPQVVQCYNRGSDGHDVQWECKTDMDNSWRFGKVEVVCEGYDYPDDPYILKGSCGLEYTLDYTKEGHHQQSGGHHNYYGDDHGHDSYSHHNSNSYYPTKKGSTFGDIVTLVIVGVIVYAIYRTCVGGVSHQDAARDRQPPTGEPRGPPPPYGFRNDYMPGGNNDDNSGSCSGNQYSSGHTTTGARPSTNATGGGFWSGAATGGLLGYLFGSRTNTNYGYRQPHNRGWGTGYSGWGTGTGGWGSGWGSTGGSRTSWGGGGGASRSSSSGTRTASGFGGTRRR